MSKKLLTFSLLFITLSIWAQDFSRVKIDIKNIDLDLLRKIDVDIDHGRLIPHRSFETDLSRQEIAALTKEGINFEVVIKDVQKYYTDPNRASELEILQTRSFNCDQTGCNEFTSIGTPENYTYGSMAGYHTLSEMQAVLDQMKIKFPDLISEREAIQPYETTDGNQIEYIRIAANQDVVGQKPEVLFTALHHAREPNSLSQMIFFMWHLLENYGSDFEITNLLENVDLYFIPCVNPDGYLYNEAQSPNGGGLWRKNTRKNAEGQVEGIDLNRNYGFEWGKDNIGSSDNPDSPTYRGTAPFSEAETQAVSHFVSEHNFILGLNYHSYSNVLIHPFLDESNQKDLNIYKGFTNDMGDQNCYIAGTSEETIGYGVNGDSDSWMYFEQAEKNKIFSVTPEVGTSFWPPKEDIDFLNKSCMPINITALKVARNYAKIKLIDRPRSFNSRSNQLMFEVSKLGFSDDPVSVFISIDEEFTNTIDYNFYHELTTGQKDTIYFDYALNSGIADGEIVNITYEVQYDEFTDSQQSLIPHFNSEESVKIADNFDGEEIIWDGDWTTTSLVGISNSNSLTDSHGSQYESLDTTIASLKEPLDLSKAYSAALKYKAKWSIEENFDYAQVLASTDGINFEPLCGEHTRIGSIDEPVYDGFQTNWVNERVDLTSFLGEEEVYVRFKMTSDDFFESDGIYIDNFEVVVIEEDLVSIEDDINEELVLSPNPVDQRVMINVHRNVPYKVYNTVGRVLMEGQVGTNGLDVSSLNEGMYFIELKTSLDRQILSFIKL